MSLFHNVDRQVARHARHLNAFISRVDPATCSAGNAAARERSKLGKSLSRIDGQQIAIKDNICTVDLPTTCGSRILKNFSSPFDATVVRRLQAAGAVINGKTNLDEFGMGSHNIHSSAGPVINPWGAENSPRSAGGSSGGSAAAVASNACYGAIGTDTGGSVRLPAAYCQVVGFKPSYGRVSRYGVVAYANSLDTVGVLGAQVERVQEIFKVLDGPDPKDPTCLSKTERALLSRNEEIGSGGKRLRFGMPLEYNVKEMDEEVRAAWILSAQEFVKMGHEVVPVRLPTTTTALAAYYILAPAEASSNLAKYDGIRYGNPSMEPRSKDDVLFARTRLEGLGDEVRRRILLGSYSLSSAAIDNYFIQAQKLRRTVQREFNSVFTRSHPLQDQPDPSANGVDLLLAPTAPSMPPLLAEVGERTPIEGYRDDVFTVPASLAGLPAISVPTRTTATGQMAPAMQLIGQYGDDEAVLNAAKLLENL